MKKIEKNVLYAKNFYLQQELRGIVDYARSHDWRLEIPQMFDLSSHILHWHGAGYLTDTPLHTEVLKQNQVRIVALSAEPELLKNADAAVIPDNDRIGEAIADYFLSRGFRNFACCSDCYDRDKAYLRRLNRAGFSAFRLNMPRYFRSEQTRAELAEQLAALPRPCAVFGNNDWEAAALCDAVRRTRFKVPEDFAIAGVGNEELICTTTSPQLSSLDTNLYLRGFRAAAELDRLLDGAPPRPEPIRIAPREMFERGSSNFFAVPHSRLRRVLNYMELNAAHGITIADTAKRFHFGESTLYRLFLQHLQISPKAFLTRLRVSLARTRMRDSDDTVATIAADCGFPSPGALYHAMKQARTSPREF